MNIPLATIMQAKPCEDWADIIRHEWPDGVPLTEDTVTRAVALGVPIDWCVEELLTDGQRAKFDADVASIRAKYRADMLRTLMATLLSPT